MAAQTGYGLYPVFVKKLGVGNTANPIVYCMVRDICCLPILVLLALISHGWIGLPNWRDWLVFVVLGITGIFLNQLFFLLSVLFIGANVTSIFQQLIPIWATILVVATCTEKFPSFKLLSAWLKLLGILFAVIGAIEMSFFRSNSQDSINKHHSWYGYIFINLSTLSFSIYMVCQKRFIFDKPTNEWRTYPIWVLAWSYLPGSISISLASLYYISTPSAFYIAQQVWIVLVYAVIITSCFCYIIVAWSNSKISASIVTAFWPIQVIVCFIASYFINGELLNPLQYIGAVLVISGLIAVITGRYLEERRERIEQEQ
ncbi:WAT1-related protein [Oopsacas minuta]|uniref:WAT1-related protein n=1 Tax=Oopsacas minuta TaxID=111878 RepID=A0AAV7KHY4_9METZ|nr:WAT1-related protein [Oopsacas minuta]